MASQEPSPAGFRQKLFWIIFETHTPAGKAFDVALIGLICLSVLAAVLESVPSISLRMGRELLAIEWLITGLFTLEYLARLYCVRTPFRYATSFFGVIDLLAVLPAYLSLLLPGAHSLVVIRALRLLRVMRIFKLAAFLGEATYLMRALRASRRKIVVFMATVLLLDVVLGSIMYVIEGEDSGFTNIPISIYWAIVTMTTVGYGDIAPASWLGRLVAAGVMILGYSIIAVPTGIVTAEMYSAMRPEVTTRSCPGCLSEGHEVQARYCKDCGAELPRAGADAPAPPAGQGARS